MTTDTITEPRTVLESSPTRRDDIYDLPKRRSWTRTIFMLGGLALFASTVGLLAATMSTKEAGPQLTHTIERGDLVVTITEQGLLESSENTEIKCKVRGRNTVLWVIDSGTMVEPGDELVRLDKAFIQEQIDERTKYAHWSRSGAEHSAARVARAKLAVEEYEQGRYVAELMKLETEVAVAKAQLRGRENMLAHAQVMADSEYVSELEVEEKTFAVKQAKLEVGVKETQLDVLKRFTREEQLQTLKGQLKSVQATHKANVERAMADGSRRDRALEEIKHCVVVADKAGMVIHPNAAKWELQPIAEGATVHKDRILLLMPDLSKMQVKLGVHELVMDKVKVGLPAKVTLANGTIDGRVSSVASVTRPAGIWTANEVKYDTLIELPPRAGLMPGMSAEVEVIVAEHKDVLKIPVAAIVETETKSYCWVKTASGTERRVIVLGDSNDIFTIVKQGLEEGDEVVLNPLGIDGVQQEQAKEDDQEAGKDEQPKAKDDSGS